MGIGTVWLGGQEGTTEPQMCMTDLRHLAQTVEELEALGIGAGSGIDVALFQLHIGQEVAACAKGQTVAIAAEY